MLSRKGIHNFTLHNGLSYAKRGLMTTLMIITVALALSGCASLEGKISPSTKADVGYFADRTITMMSQAEFTFTRNESVYTREFIRPDAPEEKRLWGIIDEVDALFDKILDYSLNLVVVYETYRDDAARIEAYADSIETVDADVLRQTGLNQQAWDALIADVRRQTKFMKALEAAQPILSGAGWYMNLKLNEAVDATDQVAQAMEQRIDDRYAQVVRYHDALLEEKYAILEALEQVYNAYTGDQTAYDRLRQSRAIRKKGLVPKGKLSEDDLEAVANHLMTRLDALHRIDGEIEPEWKIYRASHQELDNLYDKMQDSIRTARLLTMVWVHAHYQMASGRSAPAEWFDIKNVGEVVTKGAVKAIF